MIFKFSSFAALALAWLTATAHSTGEVTTHAIQSIERSAQKQARRLTTYQNISRKLASLSNQEFAKLLEGLQSLSTSGTTGPVFCLELDGTKIFVKRLPLADIEKSPENWESTKNVFELPPHYQYPFGSMGFGAWRELAAHRITTGWVLNGKSPHFPLLYHARVLEKPKKKISVREAGANIEKHVGSWDNLSTVRKRLESITHSSTELLLLLEYIPQTLNAWFREQIAQGEQAVKMALTKTAGDVIAITSFMNTHGMLHFDLHPGNILTDGEQLYFTDFGLATSLQFELSAAEVAFFEQHQDIDKSSIVDMIVSGILLAMVGENTDHQDAILHEYTTGNIKTKLPADITAMLKRCAPATALTKKFRDDFKKDKTTPYPTAAVRDAHIATGLFSYQYN